MKYILFSLIVFVSTLSYAQHPQGPKNGNQGPAIGIVSGKIIDSQTKKPIEYATISIFRKKDSSLVKGGVSNSRGEFSIGEVPFGRFRLKVNFIGYETYVVDSFAIFPKNTQSFFNTIELKPATKLLNSVEIVGENNFIQNGIDKKIYNVDKNLTTTGGTATDVLQNIPSVNVDIDGNVTLRGSGNMTILIDGKPSGMVAASKQQALEQIPASSIQSIEIITNPSAKYDPEGMSGIINIVLKKNIKQGINGMIQGSAGTGEKYNGSFSLGYRDTKMNLAASYSYLDNRNKGWSNSKRYNTLTDSMMWYNQRGESFGHRNSHMGKLSADFYVTQKTTIGASAMVSKRLGDPTGYTKYYSYNNQFENLPLSLSKRQNQEESDGLNMDYGVNFRRTFDKPDRLLTADFQFSNDNDNEDNRITTHYYDPVTEVENGIIDDLEMNKTIDKNQIINFQTDYVHPLKKADSKFETGFKSTFKNIDNDYTLENYDNLTENWITDTSISNRFKYLTQIHAAYGTYSNTYKKLSFLAGLRLEEAFSEFTMTNNNESFSKNYFSFFPSLHIAYKPNDLKQWQLSYTRRVNRPSTESINPYHHITDPLNVRIGNPKIDPEYIDAYEASYAQYWKNVSLTSSLFYKKVNNMVTRYKISFNDSAMLDYAPQFFDTKNDSATLTTFLNYSNSQSYGFEFILMANVFKIVRLNGTFSLYESRVNGENVDAALNSTSFGWTSRVNANVSLPKGFDVQLSGNYSSPMKGPQGTFYMGYSMDGAIKKEILKGKGSIGFRVSDIFDTRKMQFEMTGTGFKQEMERRRDSRSFYINFSYRFGKSEKQRQQKKKETENDGGFDDYGM